MKRNLTPEARERMRAGARNSHKVHHNWDRRLRSEIGRRSGRIGGKRVHVVHPNLAHENGIKGTHSRFHTARGKPNPQCPLCLENRCATD